MMGQIKRAMRNAAIGDVIGAVCLVGGWVAVLFTVWGFQP